MNTISVEVLNPRSLPLLEELEKLQLIVIHKSKKVKSQNSDFIDLVQKLRLKSRNSLSLEEITAEVEQQRAEMYAIST
jgi:hypothetical protein